MKSQESMTTMKKREQNKKKETIVRKCHLGAEREMEDLEGRNIGSKA